MRYAILTTVVYFISMIALSAGAQQPAREIDPDDISLPDDYRIEALASNLSIPTTAIFEGEDLLIAESGYKNTAQPRVLRIKPDGSVQTVANEGLISPVTG